MAESMGSASGGEPPRTHAQIVAALATFVQGEAGRDEAMAIGPATDIIGEGLVDSVGIFKLIAFVEERFPVTIEPKEVLLENFRTLGTLADLIVAKLNGGESPSVPAAPQAEPT
jgi:acyl carrier protein